MRICGLDPGLQVTGYAVIERHDGPYRILAAGTINSTRQPSLSNRLLQISDSLCEVLDESRPTLLAVEQIYSHYNHPQTAVLMGHARGIILLAAAQRQITVREYSATQIKRAVSGNGRASKRQVQQAVRVTLGLSRIPEPHDVADALAAALCAALCDLKRPAAMPSACTRSR